MDVYLVFFFSSRRRHTRWTGDWSSDVCSSDLATESSDTNCGPASRAGSPPRLRPAGLGRSSTNGGQCSPSGLLFAAFRRSEERRVGKGVDLGGRGVSKKKNRDEL